MIDAKIAITARLSDEADDEMQREILALRTDRDTSRQVNGCCVRISLMRGVRRLALSNRWSSDATTVVRFLSNQRQRNTTPATSAMRIASSRLTRPM